MSSAWGNHTSGLTTDLAKRYPELSFGGMMLGKAASNGDPYQPERIIVLLPAIRDRQQMRATTFTPGMKHVLGLASWEAQPEQIKQWPIEDDIAELDLPYFYALAAGDKESLPKGDLRPKTMARGYAAGKIRAILDEPAAGD